PWTTRLPDPRRVVLRFMSRLAEVAMDLFVELFGSMLAFVYHCFDRIVIHGYLSSLSRPDQVVYFFRQVVGVPVVSKEVLSRRLPELGGVLRAHSQDADRMGREGVAQGRPCPASSPPHDATGKLWRLLHLQEPG